MDRGSGLAVRSTTGALSRGERHDRFVGGQEGPREGSLPPRAGGVIARKLPTRRRDRGTISNPCRARPVLVRVSGRRAISYRPTGVDCSQCIPTAVADWLRAAPVGGA